VAVCQRCGREIAEGSEACGYCARPQPRTSGGFRGLAIALVLVAAGAASYTYFAYYRGPGAQVAAHDQIAALYHTARGYEEKGQLEAAAQAYSEVVKLQPAWPYHRRNLARVLLRLGKFGEAQAQLQAAVDQELRASPADQGLLLWLYHDLALASMGQHDYDAGEQGLEKAKQQRPAFEQTPPYLVAKAIAAAGRGRGDSARQLLDQALAAQRDMTLESVSSWLSLAPNAPEAPVLKAFLDETRARKNNQPTQ